MMGDEASSVGVELVVLAASREDCAVATADEVIVGEATDEASLRSVVSASDVVTFDHELLDLNLLEGLATGGAVLRPNPRALRFSVDKAHQREMFSRTDLPLPAFRVVRGPDDVSALQGWTARHGAAPVLKAARGGYDGRGVLFPRDDHEAAAMALELLSRGDVVAEERVSLLSEVAQLVVRAVDGDIALYPLVTTVQSAGMCAEVRFPADLAKEEQVRAGEIAREIAQHIGLVGVMAVEFFVTPGGLVINELALRPHNSGHWTIEGCVTSQFANHLRAVSGQSLGPTTPRHRAAVMVNVVGAAAPGSLDAARRVEGVHVHDYGKTWRPGRKLGHVSAVGDDPEVLHVRAWQSARAYGTSTREA